MARVRGAVGRTWEAAGAAAEQEIVEGARVIGPGQLGQLEVDVLVLQQRLAEGEAADGEEALVLAEENAGRIDMMISDVIMPGMDGPSLLKKARAFLADAPVMFISGYAEAEFSDLLEDEAGVSFLPKPIDIKTLAERVKQELRAMEKGVCHQRPNPSTFEGGNRQAQQRLKLIAGPAEPARTQDQLQNESAD